LNCNYRQNPVLPAAGRETSRTKSLKFLVFTFVIVAEVKATTELSFKIKAILEPMAVPENG